MVLPITSLFPASNVTDGIISRKSSWTSAKGARTPHMLVLNLQKYYDIDRIVIYTGIPEPEKTEQEKGQAPGFWAMKNFKIQYWDDANWTDLPNTECTENRLDKIEFTFTPQLTTFQCIQVLLIIYCLFGYVIIHGCPYA